MKKTLLYLTLSTCTLLPAYAAIPDGGWSVTPKNGSTVDKITEITVSKTNEHYMDPYINRSVKINGEAGDEQRMNRGDDSRLSGGEIGHI